MKEPFIKIDADDYTLSAFEVKPIEGYELPVCKETGKEFPYCCDFHKGIFEGAEKWFSKFPYCCEGHSQMVSKWWYNKDNYKGVSEKIVKQLSYTEHHITERINADDWYKDITDYIEYNISSFGHPPIGLHLYLDYLKHWINKSAIDTSNDKRKRLIEFLDIYNNEKSQTDKADFNILLSTYQKWLKTFPFDVSFFNDLKPQFEGRLPILSEKPVINRYTRLAKAKMHTKSTLIESLQTLTKRLLKQINVSELIKSNQITDVQGNILELSGAELNTKTAKITGDYSKGELKYVKALKKWLEYNKEYFKEVAPLLKSLPPQQTRNEKETVLYTAKHYVLAYLIECNAKGESYPIGQKKELEKIGNNKMGAGKGNRFYKVFNEVVNKDINAENNLVEIGGENWRTIVKDLSRDPETIEKYLQNKQL